MTLRPSMPRLPTACLIASLVLVIAGTSAPAGAVPFTPQDDDEVIDTLPVLGGFAAEQRRLRRAAAQRPDSVNVALALSRSLLAQARRDGDARLAGQALGALSAWDRDPKPPTEVRLQRATLHQHLHDFEGAAAELEAVLQTEPRQAQALLTLATVRRVQGRYADSDSACDRLTAAGQPDYAKACRAENQALRGQVDPARRTLLALAASRPGNAGWAAWTRTTLGELELRAGRLDEAVGHLRQALAAEPDPYARLVLADALLDQQRAAEAHALMAGAGDSDAVLLRRAIAARRLGAPDAQALRELLAARYAQAALRPEAGETHARERARFALEVEADPQRAVELARRNLDTQREAIDVVLLARAARAARDDAALKEALALAQRIGLVDVRLEGRA